MTATILVIDDDYFMRKLIEVMLVKDGFSVLQASSIEEAIDILSGNKIEIITCDIMMPDMDGIAFLKQLKSNNKFAHIPVIVITAAGVQSTIQEAIEQGACCVVEKPFTDTEIIGAIQAAISN